MSKPAVVTPAFPAPFFLFDDWVGWGGEDWDGANSSPRPTKPVGIAVLKVEVIVVAECDKTAVQKAWLPMATHLLSTTLPSFSLNLASEPS